MVRYKRLIGAAAIIMAAASVFTGCKKQQKSEPIATEQTTAHTQPEVIRSYTTGKEVESPAYPILVSIPNDGTARPQYGISKADIVYEMYVEHDITRFLAVFADNMPERVEPVRSARIYTVDIVEDWLGALVHFGGPDGEQAWSVYKKFETANIKYRLDGLVNSTLLVRDSSRKAPNNVMLNLKEYSQTISETPDRQPFKFSNTPTVGNRDVNSIEINYRSDNKVSYKYNAENASYERYVNEEKFVDASDNTHVSVQNIVIQEAARTDFNNGGKSINLDLIGSGKAYFHIGGKMTEGTWERASRSDSTVYKDTSGNEINLSVGQTFVQIVTDAVSITNS